MIHLVWFGASLCCFDLLMSATVFCCYGIKLDYILQSYGSVGVPSSDSNFIKMEIIILFYV
jgi:hypothetical protein